MQPDNDSQQTAPVPTQPEQQSQQQPLTQSDPSFYRQYWPFGLIFIFAPFGVIFGLIVLFTGDVFKKVNGSFNPISKREKITLVIIGILLQVYGAFSFISR